MSQQSDNNPFDPTGMWKNMRDASMDAWSKMMVQLVNSDAYSQATATMLDSWLAASAPFRKVVEQSMTQVLTQFNMPTRSDVTTLAERLTNIEMRLDDMEAKYDAAQRAAPSKQMAGIEARLKDIDAKLDESQRAARKAASTKTPSKEETTENKQ